MARIWTVGALTGFLAATGGAATLAVGPGKPWPAPCAAIAAAAPGDTIEIDAAGDYTGDVCAWSQDGLTLRGTGGRARIDAGGRASQGKAIWVIAGNDTVVENIEFSGAAVPDRNGAGIRQEGRNLTLRNCYFHDNETGLLAGDSSSSEILIEYSEFGFNGARDGQSHNLYVNHVARFTMRFSYSHHSRVGHLVKSRAAENYILFNRLSDEAEGDGSYEIDLPNGGRSVVMGNVVEQGPKSGNATLLAFREEGPHAANPDNSLFVVNNTFVNHRPGSATFIFLAPGVAAAVLRNNIFAGPGAITNQSNAILEGNAEGLDAAFSSPDRYDFHLRPESSPVDAGADAGPDLTPRFHYVHPACGEGRRTSGAAIDAGAFEFGGASFDPAAPPRCRMIFPGGIVNGADFAPGPLSPGSVAAVFGANLVRDDDTTAAVSTNGNPARLLAARADQIVIEIPASLAPGPGLVSVSSGGAAVAEAPFDIAALAPAIFVSALRPALSGAPFDLYFTGYGDAAPAPQSMQVAIGGKPADVRQVEALAGYAGVSRASMLVPPLDPGVYILELTVAGGSARPARLVILTPAN